MNDVCERSGARGCKRPQRPAHRRGTDLEPGASRCGDSFDACVGNDARATTTRRFAHSSAPLPGATGTRAATSSPSGEKLSPRLTVNITHQREGSYSRPRSARCQTSPADGGDIPHHRPGPSRIAWCSPTRVKRSSGGSGVTRRSPVSWTFGTRTFRLAPLSRPP